MAIDHEGIEGRDNLYKVNPRFIKVKDGWNPRTDFSGEDDLMKSIIENGVLQPLKVKKVDGDIILIDGERRLRATLRAIAEGNDIATVPCTFARKEMSDIEALCFAIIANDGKRLDPVEEAEAFNRLRGWGLKPVAIAQKLGKSDVFVYKRLILVDASPELKEEIKAKGINLAEAEKIIKQSKGSIEKQRESITGRRKSMRTKQIEELYAEKETLAKQDYEDYAEKRYYQGMVDALKAVLGRD